MTTLVTSFQLISKTWTMYKANFSLFAKYLSLFILPIIISDLMMFPTESLNMNFTAIVSLLMFAVLIVLSVWTNTVFITFINDLTQSGRVDASSATKKGWTLFWSYLLISILAGIITFLGFLALIIPGVIFGVWYAFSLMALILDGVKGMEALRYSKSLVKGKFFSVLWRLLIPGLFYGIVMMILMGVIGLIIGLATGGLGGMFGADADASWWAKIVTDIMSIYFAPLFIIPMVLLYQNVKANLHNTAPTQTA